MKTIRLLLSIMFLAAAELVWAQAPAEFATVAGWDKQVFPSYLLATGALKDDNDQPNPNVLGDPNGQFGISLVAPAPNTPVKLSINCPEFMELTEFASSLPNGGETYTVTPKIRYRYDALSDCRQATPATVTVTAQIGDQPPQAVSLSVTFRSVNDCPLRVVSGGQDSNTSFTFAAYVNEQHPFVDKLLREALDLRVVDRFTGYQTGDPQEVLRQVYALWDLMVARDMRYSNITTTAADSDEILSQHVRLIEDTINNGQANCVDGSVLFVSLLRKIGINAGLVLEPGHCYVAFQIDEGGEKILGLETTAMDNDVDPSEEMPDVLNEAVPAEKRGIRSWPTFVKAVCLATDKIVNDDKRFGSAENPEYRIINVTQARKAGVLPIPYRGNEEFLGYDYSEYVESQYGEDAEPNDEESDDEADGEADDASEDFDDEEMSDVDSDEETDEEESEDEEEYEEQEDE